MDHQHEHDHDRDRTRDGNALAGDLSAVFTPEMTSATVTCAGCGDARVLAEGVAYVEGPGTVLRCRACQAVLARIVRARDTIWMELRGMASIRVPAPAADEPPG